MFFFLFFTLVKCLYLYQASQIFFPPIPSFRPLRLARSSPVRRSLGHFANMTGKPRPHGQNKQTNTHTPSLIASCTGLVLTGPSFFTLPLYYSTERVYTKIMTPPPAEDIELSSGSASAVATARLTSTSDAVYVPLFFFPRVFSLQWARL